MRQCGLNIVNNEVKHQAETVQGHGVLPGVECLSSQINQVIMNIVVNAAPSVTGPDGQTRTKTGAADTHAWREAAGDGGEAGHGPAFRTGLPNTHDHARHGAEQRT